MILVACLFKLGILMVIMWVCPYWAVFHPTALPILLPNTLGLTLTNEIEIIHGCQPPMDKDI